MRNAADMEVSPWDSWSGLGAECSNVVSLVKDCPDVVLCQKFFVGVMGVSFCFILPCVHHFCMYRNFLCYHVLS